MWQRDSVVVHQCQGTQNALFVQLSDDHEEILFSWGSADL